MATSLWHCACLWPNTKSNIQRSACIILLISLAVWELWGSCVVRQVIGFEECTLFTFVSGHRGDCLTFFYSLGHSYFYFCFSSHFSEKSYAPNRKKIISPKKIPIPSHSIWSQARRSTDFCFFSWDHTHLSYGPGQVSHLVWQSGAHLLLNSSAKTHPLRKAVLAHRMCRLELR